MTGQALNRFCRSVGSHTITLEGLDVMSSLINIPIFFYFENKNSDVEFMSSRHLQESFYETLHDFPILAGNLCQTNANILQAVIDKNNINLPDYKETQCDVHFDTLKKAKYDWAALPENVATTGATISGSPNGNIKLASIHVLRLKDNSGVVMFVSIAHALVDGTGFVLFMQRWSEICSCMRSQGPPASIPNRAINHDRSHINNSLSEDCGPPNGPSSNAYVPGGILSRWMASTSPQFRGKLLGLLSSLLHSSDAHYYISRQKLQALRMSIQEFVPSEQRMSDNDLITTLLTIVTVQSQGTPHTPSLFTRALAKLRLPFGEPSEKPPKLFGTMVAVNVRPRLKGFNESAGYCGNAFVPVVVPNCLSDLQAPTTPELLAKVAKSIHTGVLGVDELYIREYVDLYNSKPDYYLRPMLYSKHFAMQVFSSNLSRMGWYDIDFGWGIPEFVTFMKGPFAPVTTIMPAHPSFDGYIVHTMFSEKQSTHFKESALWTETAELIR